MNSKKTLQEQFQRFVKNPLIPKYFTKDLYEFMHVRGCFIAHYNREGFYKARFLTLDALDRTLEIMSKDKEGLKDLYMSVSSDDLGMMRYRIASAEASILNLQRQNIEAKIKDLQSSFRFDLF